MSQGQNGAVDVAQVREAMSEALAPLRRVMADLDAQIETTEAELAELRALRRTAEKMLNASEPSQPRKKRPTTGGSNSMEVAQQVGEWLRANAEDRFPDGFSSSDLVQIGNEIGVERSSPSYANYLNALQAQGVLHLDRIGTGGRKMFKVAVPVS